MKRWLLPVLLVMIGNVFGSVLPAIFSKTTTPTDRVPPEEEEDIHLFRPAEQISSTHIEFLYWKAFTSGLIIAQKSTGPSWQTIPGSASEGVVGNFKTSQFNIDPGFRISQSFFRASRYWELWGSYTRLTSRGKNSTSTSNPTVNLLTAGWPIPLMGNLKHAKSSLHLNYNVVDFYVDRYFNPNPHLRMRMVAGLTGTWLTQNWVIRYFDTSDFTTRIRNTWSYWGCGVRFGMMGDWFWAHDIYLTIRGTLAGLVGPYHNRTFQTTNVLAPGVNSTLPIQKSSYRDTRAVGNLQLLIGPSWQKNWSKSRTELFVGYEFNAWMNLEEVYHATFAQASEPKPVWINNGLLGLQGLTTRFTIDY